MHWLYLGLMIWEDAALLLSTLEATAKKDAKKLPQEKDKYSFFHLMLMYEDIFFCEQYLKT